MNTHQAPQGKDYRDWQAVFDDSLSLPWTAFNTGHIWGALKNNAQPESFPAHRDPDERYGYAVMAFHFRHPTHGDVLIDTGFDRTFHDNPPYGNLSVTMRLYSALRRVRYTQPTGGIDLGSQLERHQITPAHVFLTHWHADHTGGLPAVSSEVPVYWAAREQTLLARLLCGNHFRGRSSRYLLDMNAGTALSPFARALDVFGDGTFWAVSTPGHTRDHLSYLINTRPAPVFVVGDAELTAWAMRDGILVSTTGGARGRQDVQRSASMIRAFHATYPHVQVWFSHDENRL